MWEAAAVHTQPGAIVSVDEVVDEESERSWDGDERIVDDYTLRFGEPVVALA